MANPWGLSDAQTDTRVLTSGITSALVNAVNSGYTHRQPFKKYLRSMGGSG